MINNIPSDNDFMNITQNTIKKKHYIFEKMEPESNIYSSVKKMNKKETNLKYSQKDNTKEVIIIDDDDDDIDWYI